MSRSVAWYRFRATFARRRGDYAALMLLISLIGGVGMGAVMAARSTQSAYPAFLVRTNASDLTLSTYGLTPTGPTVYSTATAAAIGRLPFVRKVESWVGTYLAPIEPNGAPDLSQGSNDINLAASNTGLLFDMDRATAIAGRLPDPSRPDEFMTTALGAQLLGIHLNQVLPMGLYTPEQSGLPGFGTAKVPPAELFHMKLVGIVDFNNQVIEDDTDRIPTNVVFTPAFSRLVPNSATFGTWYGIQLDRHHPNISSVEQALIKVLPSGADANFSITALTEARVERAVRPESIALAVFGLIALGAALGTALPVISRSLRSSEEDRGILRALGATPAATLGDGLLGLMVAIALGSILAAAVAVALSPLAPLGPVRQVFHRAGVTFDWTVIGAGFALLAGTLCVVALAVGVGTSPLRALRIRSSRLAGLAAAAGLPLPGVIGLRFALEPGRGRTAVPARSVLAGAALAVMTVTATLTFGNSLHALVTHPKLYGWNWNYVLSSENDVPPPALNALNHDPDVQAWSGYSSPNLQIDGRTVPVLTSQGTPAVGPPILSGHALTGSGQVVLGPSTLAELHKHIGDTIAISFGAPNTAPLYLPPQRATVVGTATFPAIAGSSTLAEHTTMGVGAEFQSGSLPAQFLAATQSPDPVLNGPGLVFVRLRAGVSAAAGAKDMQRIANVADAAFAKDPNATGDSDIVLPVQRPAEIVNYQSTGDTAGLLAGCLGAGAAIALALALLSTARRRRSDLALLKTFGCTRRQLGLTLLWQSAVTAAVGVVIGVPVGIAAGRQLWILFAQSINAVPQPSVPLSVGLVVVGTFALAAMVATVPGRAAARTPAAVVLRQE